MPVHQVRAVEGIPAMSTVAAFLLGLSLGAVCGWAITYTIMKGRGW